MLARLYIFNYLPIDNLSGISQGSLVEKSMEFRNTFLRKTRVFPNFRTTFLDEEM